MDAAALLEHIRRLPHARASYKQLIRELGARGEQRDALKSLLEKLEQRGELIQPRAGHYVITRLNREYAVGRAIAHPAGYGFLAMDPPLEGIAGDLFLPPREIAKVMHGDRVLVRVVRLGSPGRAEAEIVRVLERAHAEVVGEFSVRRTGCYVLPHDERIQQRILIPPGLEKPPVEALRQRIGAPVVDIREPADLDGMIVTAQILEYPDGGDFAVGRIVEVIGHPDDFGVDVEIIIRKHHLPHRFPPEVLEQARRIPAVLTSEDVRGRSDFRHLDVVTIDGETARDFDDAVWVDRLAGGNYALHVHIADVSHYVRPETPIDREALLRGTSVYFPDRAVPMLPVELSTGVCSLLPGEDRLVLSVLLEIDPKGEVISQRFVRGVIRSAARLTYTGVQQALEGDPAARERHQPLLARFELMKELALILNRKRSRRGSIDFDLPEPIIEFDEFGEMVGVSRSVHNIAHRIIEEFMLAANEAVARHLEQLGWPSIYRIHEPPDAKRVAEFEQIAAHFGYSLGVGAIPARRYPVVDRKRDGRKLRKDIILEDRIAVSSRQYQRLIARLEGKPEQRILNYLMLRSLKQARYSEENLGHFALAAPTYTHFTSPIRRYPDLMVHRILSAWLDQQRPPFDSNRLREIAEENSMAERRAADAERELIEWKKLKFMAERAGEEFSALIVQTTKFGFFVELEDLFVEGLVPIDSLPADRYGYHETTRQIIGERSRRKFSIGDRVRVLLERIDAVEKKLLFSLAEAPARKASRRLKQC